MVVLSTPVGPGIVVTPLPHPPMQLVTVIMEVVREVMISVVPDLKLGQLSSHIVSQKGMIYPQKGQKGSLT